MDVLVMVGVAAVGTAASTWIVRLRRHRSADRLRRQGRFLVAVREVDSSGARRSSWRHLVAAPEWGVLDVEPSVGWPPLPRGTLHRYVVDGGVSSDRSVHRRERWSVDSWLRIAAFEADGRRFELAADPADLDVIRAVVGGG